MNIQEKQEQIIQEFNKFTEWKEKYQYLIELGKDLKYTSDDLHDEKYIVKGCQSQVWLKAQPREQKIYFEADSDALIIRGLISLLLRVYNEHSADEIISNPPEFFQKIGMDNHLSLTRANGLAKIIKQLQLYAVALRNLGGV